MQHHNIVIFYHKDCFDGFGAAYAAWKKFKNKAAYVPLGHSQNPVDVKGKEEIYFLDFCYNSLEEMSKIIDNNKKVIIIDHHVTNEKAVKCAREYSFDIKHSGAVLAWKYFHPNKKIPRLLLHVEDQDLWNFNLSLTKEVNTALDLYDFDFKVWDKIVRDFEDAKKRKKYIEEGRTALRYKNKMIKRMVGKSDKGVFDGYNASILNSSVFASELGNELVKNGADIGIIWNQKNDQVHVSVRADKNGKTDVSKIAEKYGGGGHKTASGFGLPAGKPFPWKIYPTL